MLIVCRFLLDLRRHVIQVAGPSRQTLPTFHAAPPPRSPANESWGAYTDHSGLSRAAENISLMEVSKERDVTGAMDIATKVPLFVDGAGTPEQLGARTRF